MKILITGTTGFIGRNLLLKTLKEKKYDKIILPLRNVDRLASQLKKEGYAEIPKEIQVVIAEAPEWKLGELGPIDHVVHLAGALFATSPIEFDRVNTYGTVNLLGQLTGTPRVVLLSSQAATGPCVSGETKTEESEDAPLTAYGISKLAMEKELKKSFQSLDYTCLRAPMVLGARDQASLPLFKLVESPLFPKPGFTPKAYSYVGVDDLVTAIEAVLNSKNNLKKYSKKFFYISSGDMADTDLLKTAAQVRGRKGRMFSLPHFVIRGVASVVSVLGLENKVPSLGKDRVKEIFPNRWVISHAFFSKEFEWQPKQSLQQILQSTSDWYESEGQLKPAVKLSLQSHSTSN